MGDGAPPVVQHHDSCRSALRIVAKGEVVILDMPRARAGIDVPLGAIPCGDASWAAPR